MRATSRRLALREELFSIVSRIEAKAVDVDLEIKNILIGAERASRVMFEIWTDPKDPMNGTPFIYMRLIHTLEFATGLEAVYKGLSVSKAVIKATRWRSDGKLASPEEEYILLAKWGGFERLWQRK